VTEIDVRLVQKSHALVILIKMMHPQREVRLMKIE